MCALEPRELGSSIEGPALLAKGKISAPPLPPALGLM